MSRLISKHVFRLVQLATPIVLARIGIIIMSTVDMIMVGRFSSEELAFVGVGNSILMPLIVVGLGLLAGTIVLSANQYGAGNLMRCGAIWRSSLIYALAIGFVGLMLSLFGEQALRILGQTEEVAESGGRIMAITGLNFPAFMLVLTTAYFLESIKRPTPWMVVMIVTNIINIILNWVLIFGNLGVSAMGAEGAAWATTIARYISAATLVGYVFMMRDHDVYSVRGNFIETLWPDIQQRRIGYAASMSLAAETFSFSLLSIFAGWVGVLSLAAYGVTFNLITMVFMVTLGLGSATSVLVGNAHGAGMHKDIAISGWTGLGVNTVCMIGFGIFFFVGARFLAGLFSDDINMIDLAAPMISIAAFFLIADGGQGIMISALRGRQDIWIPSIIQVFSYFGIMLPMAYVLTFVNGHGSIGLMEGALIASCVSVVLLMWRFNKLDASRAVYSSVAK